MGNKSTDMRLLTEDPTTEQKPEAGEVTSHYQAHGALTEIGGNGPPYALLRNYIHQQDRACDVSAASLVAAEAKRRSAELGLELFQQSAAVVEERNAALIEQLASERAGREQAVADACRMHYLGNLIRSRSQAEQDELTGLMRRYPPLVDVSTPAPPSEGRTDGMGVTDDDGYDMTGLNGGPTHRDVRNWAVVATIGDTFRRSLLSYVDRCEREDEGLPVCLFQECHRVAAHCAEHVSQQEHAAWKRGWYAGSGGESVDENPFPSAVPQCKQCEMPVNAHERGCPSEGPASPVAEGEADALRVLQDSHKWLYNEKARLEAKLRAQAAERAALLRELSLIAEDLRRACGSIPLPRVNLDHQLDRLDALRSQPAKTIADLPPEIRRLVCPHEKLYGECDLCQCVHGRIADRCADCYPNKPTPTGEAKDSSPSSVSSEPTTAAAEVAPLSGAVVADAGDVAGATGAPAAEGDLVAAVQYHCLYGCGADVSEPMVCDACYKRGGPPPASPPASDAGGEKQEFAVGQQVHHRMGHGEALGPGQNKTAHTWVRLRDGSLHLLPNSDLEACEPPPSGQGPTEALRAEIVAALRKTAENTMTMDPMFFAKQLADELAKEGRK